MSPCSTEVSALFWFTQELVETKNRAKREQSLDICQKARNMTPDECHFNSKGDNIIMLSLQLAFAALNLTTMTILP